MFKIFGNSKKKNAEEDAVKEEQGIKEEVFSSQDEQKEDLKEKEEETENSALLLTEVKKDEMVSSFAPDKKGQPEAEGEFSRFSDLLNISVKEVKDKVNLFLIEEFMQKTGKVIVRYDLSESEAYKIINNCKNLGVGEILVSPAYLDICIKIVNKYRIHGQNICAFIDFPFGEGSFLSKLTDIKSALKKGVDGVTVVMPDLLLKADKIKDFKKQIKKLGSLTQKPVGVAFSCAELNDEEIKTAIKAVEKSPLKFVTFVFGQISAEEIEEKVRIINKYKNEKEIRLLANVENEDAVKELLKKGIDKVLSPYIDDVGKNLIKNFSVEAVKLL